MKIIGLKIEKYIGQSVSGHNCDFEYSDSLMEKHILCGITDDGRKVEIVLSEEEGQCGSGWTTASWGDIEINYVEKFNGYTHRAIRELIIDDNLEDKSGYISNDVFTYSYDGGDSYYPSGYCSVNMELFKEGIRHKEKRPIWVFKGNSNLGKSFIASKLNDLTVYETDTSDELPNKLSHDVIVLGNKYNFEVGEIESLIVGDYELIVVDFKSE